MKNRLAFVQTSAEGTYGMGTISKAGQRRPYPVQQGCVVRRSESADGREKRAEVILSGTTEPARARPLITLLMSDGSVGKRSRDSKTWRPCRRSRTACRN